MLALEGSLAFDDRTGVETFAKVALLSFFVAENGRRVAADENSTLENNVASVGNRQSFSFAVIGEQN